MYASTTADNLVVLMRKLVVVTLVLLVLCGVYASSEPESNLAHVYTLRPRNMVLLMHGDGRMSSFDLNKRAHLWTSESLGGSSIRVDSDYMASEETMRRDPMALPFIIKGNSLYTHIPINSTLLSEENQSSSLFDEKDFSGRFFMNISTLLRRQSVSFFGADIYASTAVSFAHINALNGDILKFKSNGHSHSVKIANSSYYKNVKQMIPIIRVTRYDIEIGAYKPDEYDWTLTFSRYVVTEYQCTNDACEEEESEGSNLKVPRFFSHIIGDLLSWEDERKQHNENLSKFLIDPRRDYTKNADILEKTLFLKATKYSFSLFDRSVKKPLAVFHLSKNDTSLSAGVPVVGAFLVLEGCDRIVAVPPINSAVIDIKSLLEDKGKYAVATLPHSPYEEKLWNTDLGAEEMEERMIHDFVHKPILVDDRVFYFSNVYDVDWDVLLLVLVNLAALIISAVRINADIVWRKSLLAAWEQSDRNRSAYMARSTQSSAYLGPIQADPPALEFLPLHALPSGAFSSLQNGDKDGQLMHSISRKSSVSFDDFESVSVRRIPSAVSIGPSDGGRDLNSLMWWKARPPPMSVSADTIDESVTHSIPPEQPLSDVRLFQLHFRVIEKIGFGGEGSVFCVEDRVTHGKNALKIIHLTGKDEAALTKEAVLHSSFDHPNIVRFFFCWLEEVSVADAQRLQILDNDDGMDSVSYTESTFHHATNDTSFDQSYSLENSVESVFKGTYRMLFIQMEYFARGTLADELRNRVKVDRLANLRYIKDIAEGLSYLHEKGVVHRDIKPTNIFISDGGAVKIGDFGLAEARIAADGSESECPTECHMEGSPLYCSPEQARGKCNIDKYTDIFSLGVLAVELYCHFVTMHERIKVLTETKQQILPEEYIPSDYEEASLFLLMLSAEPSKRPDTRKVIRQISKLIVSLEESEEEVVEKEEGSMFPATARPPYKNPKRDASFQQTSSPNKPSESIHPVSDAMEPYGPAPPPITYSEEDCDLGTIVADEILQHTTAAALTSHFVQSPVVK